MPLRKLRTDNYKAMIRADKEEKRRTGNKYRVGSHYRDFAYNLSAALVTRALILGPLERLKIVM